MARVVESMDVIKNKISNHSETKFHEALYLNETQCLNGLIILRNIYSSAQSSEVMKNYLL